jgi:hypothetical protein
MPAGLVLKVIFFHKEIDMSVEVSQRCLTGARFWH